MRLGAIVRHHPFHLTRANQQLRPCRLDAEDFRDLQLLRIPQHGGFAFEADLVAHVAGFVVLPSTEVYDGNECGIGARRIGLHLGGVAVLARGDGPDRTVDGDGFGGG